MKKTVIILIAALLIAGGVWAYFYQNNSGDNNKPAESTDPFADIKPQSFGTQGKVTAIEGDRVVFEGAVSSVKDGVTFITYLRKTAIITSTTSFYKYDNKNQKKLATQGDIKTGSEINVLTKSNPNQNSEFEALEVLVVR
jgi:predicted ribosomally synthesized peptide with SipW-like signal peptide